MWSKVLIAGMTAVTTIRADSSGSDDKMNVTLELIIIWIKNKILTRTDNDSSNGNNVFDSNKVVNGNEMMVMVLVLAMTMTVVM